MKNIKLLVKQFSKYNTFNIETYGCQMNKSDSNMIRNIMKLNGYNEENENPEVIFLNTCSIRASAENKVFYLFMERSLLKLLHTRNKSRY